VDESRPSDRIRRRWSALAESLGRALERTRPLWLLYLALVVYGSVAVFADRYPRVKQIVEKVREWISGS